MFISSDVHRPGARVSKSPISPPPPSDSQSLHCGNSWTFTSPRQRRIRRQCIDNLSTPLRPSVYFIQAFPAWDKARSAWLPPPEFFPYVPQSTPSCVWNMVEGSRSACCAASAGSAHRRPTGAHIRKLPFFLWERPTTHYLTAAPDQSGGSQPEKSQRAQKMGPRLPKALNQRWFKITGISCDDGTSRMIRRMLLL